MIYIVDDDEAVRSSLGILAKAQGWQVKLFGSARAFLHEAGKLNGCPTCLVVDLQMPQMDGAELLEYLTAIDRMVPTIVLTARPEGAMASRALAAGADQVMSKPCDPVKWLQAVQSALHR